LQLLWLLLLLLLNVLQRTLRLLRLVLWGLSARPFGISEQGLLANFLIVCICLFKARLFGARNLHKLFKIRGQVDAGGRQWRANNG